MKIVVCVKQVPGNQNVTFASGSNTVVRDGIELVINPFDTYALEQAVLIKEALGGEVIAVSMGTASAEATLREAISCGADSAILVSDDAIAGADTNATSAVLAATIEKIGDVDLVLCGKQSIDGDNAHVAPGIAARLAWTQAAFVSAMPDMSETSVTVQRMFEFGHDECAVSLPAVISVVKDINSPRIPSLRSRMASKKAEIPTWSAGDIGLDETVSLTTVTAVEKAPPRDANTLVLEGEAAETAASLVAELRKRSLV